MQKIRTRFAPSPTGYLHIGGLRTALYTWLFTRKNGGEFVLRIEDTDQQRLVPGAVEKIYEAMHMAGLTYDEGPDIGGPYGPYIQTQRRELYRKYAQELVEKGGAYYCFCTPQELEQQRALAAQAGETYRYGGKCRELSMQEAQERIQRGEPYVVRQKVPQSGVAAFDDLIFGHIEVDVAEIEDGVLLKSDGLPTYNFANVVDDHLMHITHILRGTEYLSSTPRYNLIYEAFGWEIPTYLHLPPVMKDEKQKLSKRHGAASFEDFLEKGYLKEAILNYIALLGWSPGGTRELYTLEELVEAFDIKGLSHSPAIFDEQKLMWMNAEYIKAMTAGEFYERAREYIAQVADPDALCPATVAAILQPRINTLCEIPEKLEFLRDMPDYDCGLYAHKKMKTTPQLALALLMQMQPALAGLADWSGQAVHDAVAQLAQQQEQKAGQWLFCLRLGLTGRAVTPGGAAEAAELLGKEESLQRLARSIELLRQYCAKGQA